MTIDPFHMGDLVTLLFEPMSLVIIGILIATCLAAKILHLWLGGGVPIEDIDNNPYKD